MTITPNTAALRPLAGVQYLRAIAALFVAYFHSAIQLPALTPLFHKNLLASLNFAAGVDIFFVISGFIMLVTSSQSRPVDFIIRRVIRVVPLYWILTVLVSTLLFWKPELFRTTVVTIAFFVKSLLFIPYANPGHGGDIMPILTPGWSLNFEMFFYLMFAFALFFPRSHRVKLCGLIFAALAFVHIFITEHNANVALAFFTQSRIFEFWLGMVIGELYLARKLKAPRWCALTIASIAFVVILAKPSIPDESFLLLFAGTMLPAAAIVLGTVSLEQNFGIRPLAFFLLLGNASYSMYLSHIFALGAARLFWTHAGLGQTTAINALCFALFSMTLVVLIALVVYRSVEKPIAEALHVGYQRWRATREDVRRCAQNIP